MGDGTASKRADPPQPLRPSAAPTSHKAIRGIDPRFSVSPPTGYGLVVDAPRSNLAHDSEGQSS
jgi:hypothetical protein